MLFNGPFKLENWSSPAGEWELVKNEDYWDADTVKLDKITFVVSKDPQTNVQLYEKGEIDRTALSSDLVDQYITHDDYVAEPTASVFYLKMNQVRNGEKTPLANANIRRAIAHVVDRQVMVDEILNNGSIVATGLVPKDFVQTPDGKDFREQNGDLIVHDEEAAVKYWEKGLEELGVDSIELELLADDGEGSVAIFNENLANQLSTKLPGLTVKLKKVPFKERLTLDSNQDYDLQVSGWSPDYLDPYTFLSLWVTDGGNNKMGYSNPEYDKLLEDAQTTYALDPEARFEALLKAEQILLEDAAIAPLYQRAYAMLYKPHVQGIVKNQFGADYDFKWAYVE